VITGVGYESVTTGVRLRECSYGSDLRECSHRVGHEGGDQVQAEDAEHLRLWECEYGSAITGVR
jgi:hypothetical protein